MNKSLTLTGKLLILLALAVVFGATLIALSTRENRRSHNYSYSYVDGDRDNAKKFNETFSVSPDGELVIDSDLGDIEVVGTEASEVTMEVTVEGSKKQVEKFDVAYQQEGNTVRITGRAEKKYFRLFDSDRISVEYVIHLPSKFNLMLETSGGNIMVQNVEGKLKGRTSGGDLDLDDLNGTITMETSGGNISLRNTTGELWAETSGGNIIGDRVSGATHVETSGGNITFRDSDGKLYASTSGGDIRVSLADNKGIDVSTSGGNITVSLPKSITADIQAESSGGDVSCDFAFAGKLREGSLNGTINGGGNLIKAETSGGDIVINELE